MSGTYCWGISVAMFLSLSCGGFAQDNVTIPKSRLEELERKEAELEKLKGKPAARVPEPGKSNTSASSSASAQPVAPVAKPGPSLASLPPHVDGQEVEAAELAGYFRQDLDAANHRFRDRKMVVRGEVVSFEAAMFRRKYRVILPGNDRGTRVSCEIGYPQTYSAVYTVDNGSRLVGVQGQTTHPIAKIGDRVLVTGVCKGLRGSVVLVQGKQLDHAP